MFGYRQAIAKDKDEQENKTLEFEINYKYIGSMLRLDDKTVDEIMDKINVHGLVMNFIEDKYVKKSC